MTGGSDFDRERRRIVRKITLITWGLAAAAVFMAAVGGALLAWIFTGAGFPFLRTWLIISLLLLAIPGAVHLSPWPKRKGPPEDAESEGGPRHR